VWAIGGKEVANEDRERGRIPLGQIGGGSERDLGLGPRKENIPIFPVVRLKWGEKAGSRGKKGQNRTGVNV